MKTENILAEIKSKSLKEARDEINEILTKLESRSIELNNYSYDYQRLIKRADDQGDTFNKLDA